MTTLPTSSASSSHKDMSIIPDEAAVATGLAERKHLSGKLDIPCCSICLDETKREKVRTVCTCHRLVHLSCLEKWLEASHSKHCEICRHEFSTRIEQRYSKPASVVVWLAHIHSKRALLSDLLQLIFIGFMIGLGFFIIIKSFTEQGNIDLTSRIVSSFGAAIMVLIIGTAFVVCCCATYRQYREAWYNWYVQCNKVTIVCTPGESQMEAHEEAPKTILSTLSAQFTTLVCLGCDF